MGRAVPMYTYRPDLFGISPRCLWHFPAHGMAIQYLGLGDFRSIFHLIAADLTQGLPLFHSSAPFLALIPSAILSSSSTMRHMGTSMPPNSCPRAGLSAWGHTQSVPISVGIEMCRAQELRGLVSGMGLIPRVPNPALQYAPVL